MDVQHLLTEQVVQDLGPDHLPVAAVLVVETVTEHGHGLRFYTSGVTKWHAAGMVSSALRRLEHHDLTEWLED